MEVDETPVPGESWGGGGWGERLACVLGGGGVRGMSKYTCLSMPGQFQYQKTGPEQCLFMQLVLDII